jgi:hypothetical protein
MELAYGCIGRRLDRKISDRFYFCTICSTSPFSPFWFIGRRQPAATPLSSPETHRAVVGGGSKRYVSFAHLKLMTNSLTPFY